LLNPHHYRAFVLPTELAYLVVSVTDLAPSWMVAGGQTLQQIRAVDPQYITWLSPLTHQYLSEPSLGFNLGGLAYYLLLLLGLASFVVILIRNPRDLHFPELLAWLLFALLSMLQARLIAFFAVVGGPIALRNLQDLFAQVKWSKSPQAGRLQSALRLAT